MLVENARQRRAAGGRWSLVQADARDLPVPSGAFDLVTAGWALGHFCSWHADDWRAQVGRALAEMRRALAPGGTLVILETLGTGAASPAPPKPVLADYYALLETEWGFARREVATDYRFDTPAAAEAATRFFFGDALADRIRAHGWSRIPEWTGVWSLRP
jgi:ubiquinone/menaquinone biosynthesis C-methylase UbiE